MKNFTLFAIITFCIYGCSSSDTKKVDSKTNMEVGIPNANGNIPDTTNAINLSTQKKDSSVKTDSIRK